MHTAASATHSLKIQRCNKAQQNYETVQCLCMIQLILGIMNSQAASYHIFLFGNHAGLMNKWTASLQSMIISLD